MDILVEHRPGGVRVIVQGPEGSEELLRIVSLLRADDRREGDRLQALRPAAAGADSGEGMSV